MQIKMPKKIHILFFVIAIISTFSHANNINEIDIEGIKLRVIHENISEKYPCNQHYGPLIPGLQACSVKDNKRIGEKIIEKSFKVVFGVTGKAMSIEREIIIESEKLSEIKKTEILKKYGHPITSSRFEIGGDQFETFCWGDCTPAKGSYVRGKNDGPSFSYIIKSIKGNIYEHKIDLEDRELYKEYWNWKKSNDK